MISAEKYGPWALITGGSEGMGVAYAHKLAAAGLNLVLIARKPGPLEETAKEVRRTSKAQVRTLSLDLIRPDMLDRIREVTDDIEVGLLICNAGNNDVIRSFLKQPLERVLDPIRLNAVSLTMLVHHFGQKMAARGRGGIIMTSSLAANAGIAKIAVYGGAKSYVNLFGEALWAELRPQGVDVLVLVAPATDTPARTRAGSGGSVAGVQPASAEKVAQEALDNLSNGPIHVPSWAMESFLAVRALPRRQAAEAMSKIMPAQD